MGWYYNIKLGSAKDNIKVIGIRHGEKMYETLLTKEECVKTIGEGNLLNRKFGFMEESMLVVVGSRRCG